jgi:hypothetical protein
VVCANFAQTTFLSSSLSLKIFPICFVFSASFFQWKRIFSTRNT